MHHCPCSGWTKLCGSLRCKTLFCSPGFLPAILQNTLELTKCTRSHTKQKQLEEEEAVLDKDNADAGTKGGSRMLRDEVTSDDIASVVASWTGDRGTAKLKLIPARSFCVQFKLVPRSLGQYILPSHIYAYHKCPARPYSPAISPIDAASLLMYYFCIRWCIASLKAFLPANLWKASVRSL